MPRRNSANHVLLLVLLACAPTVWKPALGAAEANRTWTQLEIKGEVDALYETLRAAHFNIYANRSRQEYDALHRRMRVGFDHPMSRGEIQQHFQRFVAYGNVAHANIDPPTAAWESFRSAGGKTFPAFFRVVDGRVYVDDFVGDVGLSVGDQIVAIDGTPALEWLAPLRAQLSADSDYLAYTIMENRLPMLVWQEWGEVDAFNVELARDKVRIDKEIPSLSRLDSQGRDKARPERFTLDWNAREARIIDEGIAYLRPGPFYDNRPEAEHPWNSAAFNSFLNNAFESFLQAGAGQLLIDLRNNPGGSNDFSDRLVAWFANKPFRFSDKFEIKVSEAAITSNRKRLEAQDNDPTSSQLALAYRNQSPGTVIDFPIEFVPPRTQPRFQGEVFILINRHSYSNAVSVAAIAQDYGFATILGQATADLANTYGGMEYFTLPATGIRVGFPKARILRPSRDLSANQVTPDIVIEAPLVSAKDVMLTRAVKVIAKARAENGDI